MIVSLVVVMCISHLVCRALAFSKHRRDATFCEECKCYVCSHCDCQIYHLSYQEELWAATEEQTEAKKNAKKSKKAKKKEKQKQKKAKQHDPSQVQFAELTRSKITRSVGKRGGSLPSRTNSSDGGFGESNLLSGDKQFSSTVPPRVDDDEIRNINGRASPINSDIDDDQEDPDHENTEQQQSPVDFVLYLQQTGSIIALAKLMDALEYGEGLEGDDFDDAELQMLRQHKALGDLAL